MSCVQFPITKKRGPKVRRGPCATILNFPALREIAEAEARMDQFADRLVARIECLKRNNAQPVGKRVRQFALMVTGDELRARWAWLQHHHRQWQNEELDGAFDDPREIEFAVHGGEIIAQARGTTFSEDTMRADIAKWRREIEKRTKVKDWLERLGVNWDQVRTPEQALTFAFESLQGAGPSASD